MLTNMQCPRLAVLASAATLLALAVPALAQAQGPARGAAWVNGRSYQRVSPVANSYRGVSYSNGWQPARYSVPNSYRGVSNVNGRQAARYYSVPNWYRGVPNVNGRSYQRISSVPNPSRSVSDVNGRQAARHIRVKRPAVAGRSGLEARKDIFGNIGGFFTRTIPSAVTSTVTTVTGGVGPFFTRTIPSLFGSRSSGGGGTSVTSPTYQVGNKVRVRSGFAPVNSFLLTLTAAPGGRSVVPLFKVVQVGSLGMYRVQYGDIVTATFWVPSGFLYPAVL
jgi:hypothetical protein